MAADGIAHLADSPTGRSDRAVLVAFVTDAASEATLRKGLSETLQGGLDIRRANVRQAIAALGRMPTPRSLIVDISGDPHPLAALADLAQIVEPDVRVLIIGDRDDVTFYRQVTRGLGAHEYLYKPLASEMVARHFGLHVRHTETGQTIRSEDARGGRMIAVLGARGGVGTTSVAANLAHYIAATAKRHTVLLDADLHAGNAAMMLGARTGAGLRAALESPSRIDELFVERTALPVHDRLDVLASEEKIDDEIVVAQGAAERLVGFLRRRYNFVVADAGFAGISGKHELLMQAHQRVFVLTPTLPAIREAIRLLALPAGPGQALRGLVVLNRVGMPGSLPRAQVEKALGAEIDVCIPYLPKPLCQAETLGTPAIDSTPAFRAAIVQLAEQVAPSSSEAPARKKRFFGLIK